MSRPTEFPTGFTDNPYRIELGDMRIPARDAMPFKELSRKGFIVVAGLSPDDVPAIAEIAGQESVREYCPNDIAKRWADEPMVEAQLAKDGGRGVFRLEHIDTGATAAFGWTGKNSAEERGFLPDCENTFALRAHENFQGLGLGKPFSRAIVAGSMALFGARKIGLETWGSNTPAVRSYLGAGAVLVTTRDDSRPTLKPGLQDVDGKRRDVRLYMQYPQSM